ncbi:hypothetical protein ABPG72_022134 [Tetrahymena utriculariae]
MDITGRLNQEVQIQELLEGCDENLVKGLVKNKIVHPTFCQEQLFNLNKERDHIVIRSGMVSGKTTGLLIVLLNDFINKMNQFKFVEGNETEDESVGLFSVLITTSKDLAQKNHSVAENICAFIKKPYNMQVMNLSTFSEDNFTIIPKTHYLIIATPSTFLKFAKHTKFDKKKFVNFAFDDIDYMLSFGYKGELTNFQFFYESEIKQENFKCYWSATEELNDDLKELKKTFLHKSVLINVDDDYDEMDDQERKSKQALQHDHDQVTHYYTTGDETTQYIILYVLFKLRFLQGKSLILCSDLETVYKVNLFLERIGQTEMQLYNHENPKNLRYYIVTLFNTGMIKTLVSTKQLFQDFKNKDFYDKKIKTNRLKGIRNIINLDLLDIGEEYNSFYKLFNGQQGNIFNLVLNEEKQIENLMNRIEHEKENFNKVNFKEFPLRRHEIEAFRYRVNNVYASLTKKQIASAKMLDFKKKMLKSPDMKEYYAKNIAEKELLIEGIQKLTKQLKKHETRCEGDVPDYLLPQFLLEQKKRAEELDPNANKKVKKILVYKGSSGAQQGEEGSKKKMRGDKYVYVNEEKENENETDASRLKILSRKKQWKLRHGFKLKRVNKRLEKKGIFQS